MTAFQIIYKYSPSTFTLFIVNQQIVRGIDKNMYIFKDRFPVSLSFSYTHYQ